MSAFLCDAAHLAAIARAAARLSDQVDAERVFNILLDENLKSIGHRYPDAQRISDWFEEGEAAFVWETIPEATNTASELLDVISSYDYQSCEHPEWQTSTARKITAVLRAALEPFAADERQAKADEQTKRRAAFSALPTLYPKETAVQVRKILKANFPATKFRVVTERGSMVSSVRISWTDGPTTKTVDALVQPFKAGHFDGMTDSYDYDRDSVITIDGKAYRSGCNYVFTVRAISPALANRCIAQVTTYWGGVERVPVAVPNYSGYKLEPDIGRQSVRADLDGNRYDWYSCIHRAAENRQEFARD